MKPLPSTRSNVKIKPVSPLGLALRDARITKQIPQRAIAQALAAKCGGADSNVRVSGFELSKKLPSDAELTVLAQILGLSVASLREKREASRGHQKTISKMLYAGRIASGIKTRLKPSEPSAAPAKAKPAKPAKPAKLASVPALAELVEQIDEIAPMPHDKEQRKRWFQCVTVLSRIGAAS